MEAFVLQVEGQCRAGQLLANLGLDISLAGMRAGSAAAAKDVLMVLLAKLADAVPPLTEARYLPACYGVGCSDACGACGCCACYDVCCACYDACCACYDAAHCCCACCLAYLLSGRARGM